jgi:hypothetical protein
MGKPVLFHYEPLLLELLAGLSNVTTDCLHLKLTGRDIKTSFYHCKTFYSRGTGLSIKRLKATF